MTKTKKPTICVCMIVKNEEAMLSRCLDSVKGADEIVVADTGSEDSTVEIARKYTDKVYTDYVWEDSFAKARNFALSKVPKDIDWILSIDADEILNQSIEEVREVLSGVGQEYGAVKIKLISEKSKSEHMFQRIFRNDPAIKWGGAAHNYVRDSKKRKQFDATELISTTYGYSPAHQLDPERTFRILKKNVKENPELTRERYYLGREYLYRREWKKAIKELDEYIKRSNYLAERNDAWLLRAQCLAKLGDYEKACDSAWEAIKYNANFKEALYFIADHMDPINKERWESFAKLADNRNVVFVRDAGRDDRKTNKSLPMDLGRDGLLYMENLLQRKDKIDVLEWGSGRSTRHFTNLLDAAKIEYTWTSVEDNRAWYEQVKEWCKDKEEVKLIFAGRDSDEYLKPKGKYDLIYVDGRNRVKCLQHAKKILKPGGVVLLHDAERERYKEGFEGYHWRYIGKDKPLLWHGQLEEMETIPKIIHQIWIGPKEMPKEDIETWKKMNPSFEHKLWTEKEIDKLGLENRKQYEEYYRKKEFSGCSNIVRAQLLRDFGGIYIDADMKCTNTIENAPFMAWDFVTIFAVDTDTRLNNAPLGCVPGHKYLIEYVKRQGELKKLSPSFAYSGPALLTEIVKDNDKVLPAYAFAPIFHSGYKNNIVGVNYATHHWLSTPEMKKKYAIDKKGN